MVVVDASVVAKVLRREAHSDLAIMLLDEQMRAGESIVAPHLLPFEVMNFIHQQLRRRQFSRAAADEALDRFFRLPIRIELATDVQRERIHRRALEIANEYDLPATYDAHYVALAELLRCDLWTADQRLVRQLDGSLPFVHDLVSYDVPR